MSAGKTKEIRALRPVLLVKENSSGGLTGKAGLIVG